MNDFGEREPRNALATMVVFIGLAAVVGYVVLAAKLGVGFAIPMGVLGLVGGTFALRGPLGHALLGTVQSAGADETTAQLLGELDELRGRVQELEERADFSDRLLAEQSRRPGTPAGD